MNLEHECDRANLRQEDFAAPNCLRRYVRNNIEKRSADHEYVRTGFVDERKSLALAEFVLQRFSDNLPKPGLLLLGNFVRSGL